MVRYNAGALQSPQAGALRAGAGAPKEGRQGAILGEAEPEEAAPLRHKKTGPPSMNPSGTPQATIPCHKFREGQEPSADALSTKGPITNSALVNNSGLVCQGT